MSRSYRRPFATPAAYGFSLAEMRRLASRHFRRRVNQQVKYGDWERAVAMDRRQSSMVMQDEFETYGLVGPLALSDRRARQALAEGREWRALFWTERAARMQRK